MPRQTLQSKHHHPNPNKPNTPPLHPKQNTHATIATTPTPRWSKGAFEEAPEGAEAAPSTPLSAHKQQRAALDANTLRHAAGLPAQHAVVCGPPGSGKSWMLWEGTLAAAKQHGAGPFVVPLRRVVGWLVDLLAGSQVLRMLGRRHVSKPSEAALRGSNSDDQPHYFDKQASAWWRLRHRSSATSLILRAAAHGAISEAGASSPERLAGKLLSPNTIALPSLTTPTPTSIHTTHIIINRYPRVRFILVADHVDLPLRGSLLQVIAAGWMDGCVWGMDGDRRCSRNERRIPSLIPNSHWPCNPS